MLIGGIVTEAAGMTHGSLYSQFGSKERLVEEALDYVMAASAQNMDGAATLADYVAGYLTASHRDMPGRGCPLAALCCEMPRQSSGVRERFTNGLRGTIRQLGRSNGLRAEATAAR
jgi:TetR/AcrR family transcriptional repressor of nem operon